MDQEIPSGDLERRKHVKLRVRPDLDIQPQRYEGKTYYVVKDPVSLRYYRFKEHEYFLLTQFDGEHTVDQTQKNFEKRFRPERLTLEDLEQFGMQLMTVGLAQNESPQAGQQLFDHRKKRKRSELMQTLTNVLYIKIPIFDPEKLLGHMLPYFKFMFTTWFFLASLGFMLSAVLLVTTHFETFYSRLPSYHEFFSPKTLIYLWIALGIIKVIHEFGHGLSCKNFGGEVHEMGMLFLCLSPAMYCNVSDSWTLPNKWHRIIISFAGIYVELMIAAASTFIWWNSPSQPFVNYMALSLMIVCSVNTVIFNGNPLMRFDGYYVLADWIEIPNLRDRANRYLSNLGMEYCLGIEVPPEPYMALTRRILFVVFAVISYVYRWVITFVMLRFLATFLKPYKLEVLSSMLAVFALGSMIGWPVFRMAKNINKRGRLPDMKPTNVTISAVILSGVLIAFFFVPLPVSRVRQPGLVEVHPKTDLYVEVDQAKLMEISVKEGEFVSDGNQLAVFESAELESRLEEADTQVKIKMNLVKLYDQQPPKGPEDKQRQLQLKEERSKAAAELQTAESNFKDLRAAKLKLVLKAKHAGFVMGLPSRDEIGKTWDKDQTKTPFCSIGDPHRNLRVLVPVPATDYDLMRENIRKLGGDPGLLPVTIRVQGRGTNVWKGKITLMPLSKADTIPAALSSKGGGPLAIKPGEKELIPQAQVFLVGIAIENPDQAICPGTMAQVKIHCEYRSAAWWVWRTVSSTFDLGLL